MLGRPFGPLDLWCSDSLIVCLLLDCGWPLCLVEQAASGVLHQEYPWMGGQNSMNLVNRILNLFLFRLNW
jgi:hypothetical protein